MTSVSDQPRFYLGCAVWAHPSWSGVLFPRNARSADYLRLYSRRLTTVEGNTLRRSSKGWMQLRRRVS